MKNLIVLLIFSSVNPVHAAGPPGDETPRAYFAGFSRQAPGEDAILEVRTGQPIIWIVIDALRPDHLGCCWYERETSPTLDKFANAGVIFTRLIEELRSMSDAQ